MKVHDDPPPWCSTVRLPLYLRPRGIPISLSHPATLISPSPVHSPLGLAVRFGSSSESGRAVDSPGIGGDATMRIFRSRPPWIELTVACLIFVLAPSTASANPLIPPIVVVWPATWILLVPVVLIEAAFAVRIFSVSYGAGLRLAFWANLWSTALGVPIGTCFNPIPLMIPREENGGLAGDLLFFASLVLPLYFVSVIAEYWVVRRLIDQPRGRKIWRWAWLANGVTYSLIAAGLLALIVYDWQTRRVPNLP